jgi:hypothetical protein
MAMAKLFIVLLAMMSLLAIASAMDNDEPPWKKPRKDKGEEDKKDKAWLCDGSFGLGFSLFVYVFVWLFVCLLCFVCLFVLCVCVCLFVWSWQDTPQQKFKRDTAAFLLRGLIVIYLLLHICCVIFIYLLYRLKTAAKRVVGVRQSGARCLAPMLRRVASIAWCC